MSLSASGPQTTSPASTAKGSLLSRFAQIFVNRRDRYLTSGADANWFSKKSRLTNRVLESALRGNFSLGLYATAEDGTSRWVAIDCDDDSSARKIIAKAYLLPANSYLIERSRRGLHLVKLFNPPVPWQAAQRYGLSFARKADCDGVEVFPKNGTFSALRAPMTVHPMTKRLYDWLDADGQILDPWDTLLALKPTPIPDRWLELPEEGMPRELARMLPFGQLTTTDEHDALVQLASRYTTLKPNGKRSFIGPCMFHKPDRHPSFGILNGYWQCWSQCLGADRSAGGLNALRARLRERGILQD